VVPKPNGAVLRVPPGFEVIEAAAGFDMARQMALAPNGDVFLSEPGANRVTVLRDADGDGRFEGRWTWSTDLDLPFGLAFAGDFLYVANTGSVVRFPYRPGETTATRGPEVVVRELPGRGFRQHWTRNLAYDAKAGRMYVSVGSASNLDEEEPHRAAILAFSMGTDGPGALVPPGGAELEIFASGLRNPVGLTLRPGTGDLWTCVNERDGLGDDLVPDYATRVEKGGFYGWPYAYIGPHPQPGFAEKRPDLVKRTLVPDVLFESHSAALGITFYDATAFPERYRGGAFVTHHGSWNRSRRVGYRVVFLPFRAGKAEGGYEDFLTGFGDDPERPEVWGRPVGVLVDRDGSLLVSDDGGEKVWRVRYRGTP
jgi:glucose/arabinose dehydrogenase